MISRPKKFLRDHPAIAPGLDHWLSQDRRFGASGLSVTDVTATVDRDLTLAALAETIVSQQLSVKAAATIWSRVCAVLDVNDPDAWMRHTDDDLRALGVSFQKIGYLRGLAQAVAARDLDLSFVKRAGNDDAIAALTSIKGFGRWSAQMILIFTLARPDIWPSGDLGVQEGLRLYRKLPERPTAQETEIYGARYFGLHLTAAALLLWRLKDRQPLKG